MKYLLFIFAGITLVPFSSAAQKVNYDFASFTPPAGWIKNEQDGVLMYTTPKNNKGTYCLLAIYKSVAGTGDLSADFNTAWNTLVAEKLNVKEQAAVEKGEPENGWDSETGTASFTSEGTSSTVILTNLTGLNNSMSILVVTNDASYTAVLEKFFQSIQMKKPVQNTITAITTAVIQRPGTLSDYDFALPQGWRKETGPNEIVLKAPDNTSVISILPMETSSGNLDTDMKTIFWQVFAGWQLDQWNPDHHIYTKGIGPGGWEYLKEEQGIRKEENGNVYQAYGIVMLAKLGGQVAIIAGSYKEGTNRLNEVLYADWISFFHSLKFKNYAVPAAYTLQKDMIGSWTAGSSSGVTSYSFAANGHYANGNAFSTSSSYDTYHTLETTTSFAGDGTYTVNGNTLTLVNSHTKKSSTSKIRIFYQKEYGDTWLKKIGMMQTAADGSLYEITMVTTGK